MASADSTIVAVSALRPGEKISGVFACVRKDRLIARNGSPYLALELRDRTGTIPARAFRDADALAGRFERGDLVQVTGRVERFRDELVIEVMDIKRGHGAAGAEEGGLPDSSDLARFLPSVRRDLDELDGFLEHLAREVYDPRFRSLLEALLSDRQLRASWQRAPCTRGGHHAYLGGLLEHTVAVTTLAHELCQVHPRLNSDLLLTAAITHDIGLVRSFTYGAEFGLSDEGRLIGHVAIGAEMLAERSRGLDEDRRLSLLHCVICHHGAAAAPGGRFGSIEALALYRLNALDAGVKAALDGGGSPR